MPDIDETPIPGNDGEEDTDDENTEVRWMRSLVQQSWERQAEAVEAIPHQISVLGETLGGEFRSGLKEQTRMWGILIALFAVLLAAVAGAQVSLHWRGLGVDAHLPTDAHAAPSETTEAP